MPILTLMTNLPASKLPASINKDFTDIADEFLQKPRSVFWVNVEADKRITMGGLDDPTAIVGVECIGRLKPGLNLKMGRRIEEYLMENLGIPRDRIVVRFLNQRALYCTYNGSLHDPMIDTDEDLK